ncbi:uncharacterized protein B0J16DRAFT_379674 [Fusarium flagelliforme]|uniref:uncharacterized protein n=1 Tax=Fusarium flagelliforme TaxID=2675880 RepID=UPI001E8DBD62|nr:uncharacterized protein B0J16DRAFT_379674 [Fusarium flagelliforme]KAH7191785.1 hypothetical protein B0J16DRAFT_379674 [Fusarium flagelliforme]
MKYSAATVILSLSSAVFITGVFSQEINCADGASEEACETNCSCVCWGDIMHCAGGVGPIPIHFLEEVNRLGIEQGVWPAIPGNPGFDNGNIWSRLFEVLGSHNDVDNFVITDEEINAVECVLMQLFNPCQLTTIETRLASNPNEVSARVRAVFSFFEYMNLSQDESGFNANPKGKLVNIINQTVRQLLYAEVLYEAEHGERVLIAQFFRERYTAYCEKVTEKAQE